MLVMVYVASILFLFKDTPTTEIYTLSLHVALPIWPGRHPGRRPARSPGGQDRRAAGDHHGVAFGACDRSTPGGRWPRPTSDRKSTRLNSSHANISYAVFCLKKINTSTKSIVIMVLQ